MKDFCSHVHGHEVYWDDEKKEWYYTDDNEKFSENYRPCPKCNQLPSKDGHDSCIANLPGIKFACCGHGMLTGQGYLSFNDGKTIYEYREPKLFRKTIKKLKKARHDN